MPDHPPTAPARFAAASLCALLAVACPKKGNERESPVNITAEQLVLPPVPDITGQLVIDGPERQWSGPARVEVESTTPLHLRVEDMDKGEVVEVILEEEGDPAVFSQIPGAAGPDVGRTRRDGSRLQIELERPLASGDSRALTVRVNRQAEATAPPDDWLAPGTMLYFGLVFDNKPITKVVPMALTARLGAGSDGSRILTWQADIDPNMQEDVTGELTRSGRKFIPAQVVREGTLLDDRFARGEDIPEANSLFLSHSQLQGLHGYGGASIHDEEVGEPGVLVRALEVDVTVQAGADLWRVPALAAWAHGGKAVYVVANDDDEPLILSARRPGYTVKLMAIGRPGER